MNIINVHLKMFDLTFRCNELYNVLKLTLHDVLGNETLPVGIIGGAAAGSIFIIFVVFAVLILFQRYANFI